MQNYRQSVWSVLNKCRPRGVERVSRYVKPIWKMLILKVSSAGKQTRRFIDPFLAACFDLGKIIQDKLDRLSNHSSMGYAIVVIISFAAMLLMSAVAVECCYHLRPYYWMILKFFFHLVCVIGRGTNTILVVMGAVLKWIVIVTLLLTLRIFVGLTTIFVCAFSWLVPNALLALTGIVHVAKLPLVIVSLMLLWRRRANRSHSSSSEGG